MQSTTWLKWAYLPLLFLCIVPAIYNFTLTSFLAVACLLAWYTARFGFTFAILGFVILGIVGNIVLTPVYVIYLLLHSFSAVCIGYHIYKKMSFSSMLISATAIETAVLVFITLEICKESNLLPPDLLFGPLFSQLTDTSALLSQQYGVTPSEMAKMSQYFMDTLKQTLPLFYLSFSLLYVYVLFGITRFILKIQKIVLRTYPKFHQLWLPSGISNIFLVLFLVSLFYESVILFNVVSFMMFIHVVLGLSRLDFVLIKKKIHKAFRVMILGAVMIFSSMLGGLPITVLCFMGMSGQTNRLGR